VRTVVRLGGRTPGGDPPGGIGGATSGRTTDGGQRKTHALTAAPSATPVGAGGPDQHVGAIDDFRCSRTSAPASTAWTSSSAEGLQNGAVGQAAAACSIYFWALSRTGSPSVARVIA
jgi:hypothetical protein